MLLVITYDVDTTDAQGAKRLRKVAKLCERNGMRVQNSVFEVLVDAAQLAVLKAELSKIIDPDPSPAYLLICAGQAAGGHSFAHRHDRFPELLGIWETGRHDHGPGLFQRRGMRGIRPGPWHRRAVRQGGPGGGG